MSNKSVKPDDTCAKSWWHKAMDSLPDDESPAQWQARRSKILEMFREAYRITVRLGTHDRVK